MMDICSQRCVHHKIFLANSFHGNKKAFRKVCIRMHTNSSFSSTNKRTVAIVAIKRNTCPLSFSFCEYCVRAEAWGVLDGLHWLWNALALTWNGKWIPLRCSTVLRIMNVCPPNERSSTFFNHCHTLNFHSFQYYHVFIPHCMFVIEDTVYTEMSAGVWCKDQMQRKRFLTEFYCITYCWLFCWFFFLNTCFLVICICFSFSLSWVFKYCISLLGYFYRSTATDDFFDLNNYTNKYR